MALKRYRHSLRPFSPGRHLPEIVLLIGSMILCLATTAPAQETDTETDWEWTVPAPRPEVADMADAILNASYQTELPQARALVMTQRPRAAIPDIFIKIGLIIAGIVVVVVAVNVFFGNRRWAQDEQPEDGDRSAGGFNPFDLGDPDELAAAGRYGEAIHTMLLRALVLAAGRLEITWPRSLTSREIMGSAALTSGARESLGDLIARVEIHHFGGHQPEAGDYHQCRQAYERLLADPIRVTP